MTKVTNKILNLSLAAILATTVSCTNDENVLNEDNSLQLKKQEDTASTQLMTCGQNAAGKKIYRFTYFQIYTMGLLRANIMNIMEKIFTLSML